MNNKKKLKEGGEPQRVAQGLPQTKEKEQSPIGEKFIKYLEDMGLKHAAYTNEEGEVKVIGLNKDQVKEAINNMVVKSELKKFIEGGLEESEEGDRIQKLNNRIKVLRDKMNSTKSSTQKNLIQQRLKNALQSLTKIKSGLGIKKINNEIGLPAGTGLNLPGGSIKDIVKNHQAQKIKDGKNGKTVTVDVQSANAVVHIYNGLGTSNRIKYVNGGLISMVNMAWKILAR
jgi:hypothetical protein